jgi:hypothetical protein
MIMAHSRILYQLIIFRTLKQAKYLIYTSFNPVLSSNLKTLQAYYQDFLKLLQVFKLVIIFFAVISPIIISISF